MRAESWAGPPPPLLTSDLCCPLLPPPEAAILESHGIEVPSPSCHSNGEEGEMQEFADPVIHPFSEQVSGRKPECWKQQRPSNDA